MCVLRTMRDCGDLHTVPRSQSEAIGEAFSFVHCPKRVSSITLALVTMQCDDVRKHCIVDTSDRISIQMYTKYVQVGDNTLRHTIAAYILTWS